MTKGSSFFIFSKVDFRSNVFPCFEASKVMQRTIMFQVSKRVVQNCFCATRYLRGLQLMLIPLPFHSNQPLVHHLPNRHEDLRPKQ
jgi:hypothetical protein